ncbi:hypothetical protein [Klebsiella pneumoniae]|uniref:hypothetical protein n=1 Tax=Klebsiella pneumoniae TaxID=573 RepID=UPI001E59FEE7|nr:hypothetical protein [Klebsiella pneumoniae]EKV5855790.1 hypothetical protein [Klebsiella pneumoniae]MCP6385776.1 hypothetical protein [Klebsiella pneumoniae]UFH14749.1 hypothetical protein LOX64_10145 [Klebsiella pneumoniae]HBR1572849.1 hypothetical protein [Klebsiella pneumoniae]
MNKGKWWWKSTTSTGVEIWCKIWWRPMLSGIAAGGTGVNITPPLVEHFLTTGGGGGGVTTFFTSFLHQRKHLMVYEKSNFNQF